MGPRKNVFRASGAPDVLRALPSCTTNVDCRVPDLEMSSRKHQEATTVSHFAKPVWLLPTLPSPHRSDSIAHDVNSNTVKMYIYVYKYKYKYKYKYIYIYITRHIMLYDLTLLYHMMYTSSAQLRSYYRHALPDEGRRSAAARCGAPGGCRGGGPWTRTRPRV